MVNYERNLFTGKYRGIVTDIQDPLMQGRMQARVPEVTGRRGKRLGIACLAFGGSQMGLFVLPAVGSAVWMEFEHGDPDYPVWPAPGSAPRGYAVGPDGAALQEDDAGDRERPQHHPG